MNDEVDVIGAWLTDRIAVYLDLDVAEIVPTEPLAAFGLDSVYTAAITGEIEERYGLEIEPSVMWEHPTIRDLAVYVHGCLNGAQL